MTSVSALLLLFALGPIPAVGPPVPGGAVQADTTQAILREARDEAVLLAREERHSEALDRLRALHRDFPEDHQTLVDLVAVLHWAGEDAEALRLSHSLPREELPAYALEALGRAARNEGDFEEAAHLYRMAVHRDPQRNEAAIGLAYSLLEGGHPDRALETIQTRLRAEPENGDLLLAGARVRHGRGEPREALRLLNRIPDGASNRDEALHLRALLASEMGAPFVAVEILEAHPHLFTLEERARLLADRGSLAARWTRVPPRSYEARFQAADRALGLLESALEELGELGTFSIRRLQFDRITALRERSRMEDVLEAVEELEAEGVELPPYVWQARGDAQLYLRRAGEAVRSYRRALEGWEGSTELRISLFHAQLQSGDMRGGLRNVDALVEEQPRWREAPGLGEPLENPDRLEADVAAALGRAFTGRLAEAERRLEPLVARAPMNAPLRQELGAVYLWRGWPRLAQEEYELTTAVDPDHVGARVGLASALMAQDEIPAARRVVEELQAQYPESEHVRRAGDELAAASTWELDSELHGARSTGGDLGTRDRGVATRILSPPIAGGHTRLVLGSVRSDARFPDTRPAHDRLSAGLRHLRSSVVLEGTLSADRSGFDRLGVAGEVVWRPDDRHRVWLHGASESTDVPLQAVIQEVTGWRIGIGGERRWSELRRISAEAGWMEMSDGNRRETAYLAAEQRVLTDSRWEVTALLEGYGSRNSLEGAPYFNPEWQAAPSLSLITDWITIRRMESSFTQRLTLGGGGQWQQGFDLEPTAMIRYEHRWIRRPRLEFRYGAQWGTPVFDGIEERRTSFFVGLNWRLP